MATKRGPAWGKIAVIVVVVAALSALWRWTPLGEMATAENIVAWTRTVRETWWAPIVLVLAYMIMRLVLLVWRGV